MDTQKKSIRELLGGLSVLKPYAIQNKCKLIFLAFFATLTAGIAPFQSYLFSILIEGITKGHVLFFGITMSVFSIAVFWGLSFFLDSASDWKRLDLTALLVQKIKQGFILDFGNHLLRLPLSFHKKRNASEVLDKVNVTGSDLSDLFTALISDIGPSILTTLVAFVIIFIYSPLLFCIALLGLVLFVFVIVFTTSKASLLQKNNRTAQRASGRVFAESVEHFQVIKNSHTEDFEHARIYEKYFSYVIPEWLKLIKYSSRNNLIQKTILIGTRVALFSVSFVLFQQGIFTLASIIFMNSLVNMVFQPLQNLSRVFRVFQNSFSSLLEVKEILEIPQEIYEPKSSSKDIEIKGNISFKNLSFSYEEAQPILSDISFEVKAGQVVALVGESGVGKSTLINLISGYYFPTAGELLIDGTPIQKISLSALRKAISIVPQEPALFNETIAYNLGYGSGITDQKILEEAARKSHSLDFIEKMPEKWNTMVGDRGVRLSVGQKQRIAIARAILRSPKILILDEPTSALDAGSEKIVVSALEELMTGRTTFIVAHRLSTVRKADMILVFKDGKIVEKGSHAELLENPTGEYKRLHDLQIGIHE